MMSEVITHFDQSKFVFTIFTEGSPNSLRKSGWSTHAPLINK